MTTVLEQSAALTKWRKSPETLMAEELEQSTGIAPSDPYGWKAAWLYSEVIRLRLKLKYLGVSYEREKS